ncbi:hypothetical protein BDB01DRAFT_773639 [Pilobolus umbonatus]|nr:hypothetical protein BDB01DRAFT_773639 [Pilobolus umbonatus]
MVLERTTTRLSPDMNDIHAFNRQKKISSSPYPYGISFTLNDSFNINGNDIAHYEKRTAHNALERQRREGLNTKFQELAHVLPTLQQIRRPSKSMIVTKSLEYVLKAVEREEEYKDQLSDLRREHEQLMRQANYANKRTKKKAKRSNDKSFNGDRIDSNVNAVDTTTNKVDSTHLTGSFPKNEIPPNSSTKASFSKLKAQLRQIPMDAVTSNAGSLLGKISQVVMPQQSKSNPTKGTKRKLCDISKSNTKQSPAIIHPSSQPISSSTSITTVPDVPRNSPPTHYLPSSLYSPNSINNHHINVTVTNPSQPQDSTIPFDMTYPNYNIFHSLNTFDTTVSSIPATRTPIVHITQGQPHDTTFDIIDSIIQDQPSHQSHFYWN